MWPNSNLFRSRWKALFWAAGIVWFAVSIAGSGGSHGGKDNAATDDDDTRAAIAALNSFN